MDMRLIIFAGLALAAAPAAAAGTDRPSCTLRGTHVYQRMADVPRGAMAALGVRMAERGQPFQATDVIMPGERLPGARFAAARLDGCTLTIRYERGGIAHTWNTAVIERRGIGWVVVRPR
ncbi:hypothetical protein GCM10023232_13610 [Sphingosinicella ginsenosidimutans]